MRAAIRRFLKDDSGAVATDWALIASVLVLGSAVGVAIVRHSLEAEAPRPADRPPPAAASPAPPPDASTE